MNDKEEQVLLEQYGKLYKRRRRTALISVFLIMNIIMVLMTLDLSSRPSVLSKQLKFIVLALFVVVNFGLQAFALALIQVVFSDYANADGVKKCLQKRHYWCKADNRHALCLRMSEFGNTANSEMWYVSRCLFPSTNELEYLLPPTVDMREASEILDSICRRIVRITVSERLREAVTKKRLMAEPCVNLRRDFDPYFRKNVPILDDELRAEFARLDNLLSSAGAKSG